MMDENDGNRDQTSSQQRRKIGVERLCKEVEVGYTKRGTRWGRLMRRLAAVIQQDT